MSDLQVIFEFLLDRPYRRSTMLAAVRNELLEICAEIEICSEVEAVVLDGAGDATDQAHQGTSLSLGSIGGTKRAESTELASKTEDVRAVFEFAAIGDDFCEGRAAIAERHSPRLFRGG